MSGYSKKPYQDLISESGLDEIFDKYGDKIINDSLDDEDISRLISIMQKPIGEMIRKTLTYYSKLIGEPELKKNPGNYTDFIILHLLRNRCDCHPDKPGVCKYPEKHNLKHWLEHQDEQGLWHFLLVAIRGDIKMKGREKTFKYSMLFNLLKKDMVISQEPLVFNECSCPPPPGIKSIYYDYWKTICNQCRTIFDETTMKRIEKDRIILESNFDEMVFYRCKNDDCKNVYLKRKELCPISDCSTSQPQRISHLFVKTGRKEINTSDYDTLNLLSVDVNGFKQTDKSTAYQSFLDEIMQNRPWCLILAIVIYEYKKTGGNLFSDYGMFQSILEGEWKPADMEWFIKVLAFTVGDEKKYGIQIKKIRDHLLNCKTELGRQGIDTRKNSTDINLKIADLDKLFKDEMIKHLSVR